MSFIMIILMGSRRKNGTIIRRGKRISKGSGISCPRGNKRRGHSGGKRIEVLFSKTQGWEYNGEIVTSGILLSSLGCVSMEVLLCLIVATSLKVPKNLILMNNLF